MTNKERLIEAVLKDIDLYWAEAQEHEDVDPDDEPDDEDTRLERRTDFYLYMEAVTKGQ